MTRGALSSAALRKAEEKFLHAKGKWLGVATYATLHLRSAAYHTAKVMIKIKKVTYGVTAAGITRHHLTYILVDTVQDPAGKAGKQNGKLEQGVMASLAFTKPAAAGSFTCTGTGISRPVIALPKANSTSTPTSIGTAAATSISTDTVTPTPSTTSTALPAFTATAVPTSAPLPGGIPTSGSTTNGCPITAIQASGESYLLGLLNADRAAVGAPSLSLSTPLSVAARDHTCDMVLHVNLSHTGSDGSDPLQRIQAVGVTYTSAGENVGDSSGHGFLPAILSMDQQMMAELPTQGTHHWNIINPAYTQVGIGVIAAGPSVWITEDFVG